MIETIRPIQAVDLFCGVGGLTHGLLRAGVQVQAGVDLDSSCKFAFEANNEPAKFVIGDVSNFTAAELGDLFEVDGPQLRLLAGCAPCQPFSTYARSGRSSTKGDDWQLVRSFGRLVAESQPDLVTMENVPQLADHTVFHELLEMLGGYAVSWRVVDCAAMGVPQTRQRLVLLGARGRSRAPELPKSGSDPMTVRDAIGELPAVEAGETSPSDPIHVASRLSKTNQKRIRASAPGGTWRDWPEDLRADCHKRGSGATYPSVYGRMEWDKPSPTITTQCFGYGNGRFGHPEQHRAITLREAAVLQTFPVSYKFVRDGEGVRFNRLGRLIGNAVPVALGEAVGKSLIDFCRTADSVAGRS